MAPGQPSLFQAKDRLILEMNHVLTADKVGIITVGAERHPPSLQRRKRILGIEDREIVFSLLFEDSELRRAVFLKTGVTVKVVRREVEPYRDSRMKSRNGFQLESAY